MVSPFVLFFLFQLISLLQIREFLLLLKRCTLAHTKEINSVSLQISAAVNLFFEPLNLKTIRLWCLCQYQSYTRIETAPAHIHSNSVTPLLSFCNDLKILLYSLCFYLLLYSHLPIKQQKNSKFLLIEGNPK